MKKNKLPGYDALKRMQKSGNKSQLVSYEKDDDLAIIELAISPEVDGWIVTNDTFDKLDYKRDKDNKVLLKERQIYKNDYDWDDIDSRLWGVIKLSERGYHSKSYYSIDETWHIEGDLFFHTGLKKASLDLSSIDPYIKLRKQLDFIERGVGTLDAQCERMADNELELTSKIKHLILHLHPYIRKLRNSLPTPTIPERKTLDDLLVVELKQICINYGLKRTGRKSELIERILDFKNSK